MDGTEQHTLFGDPIESDEAPDTSEDYNYSRPQCHAATAAGDRCSNPVRRTDGDPDYCPQHYDTDGVERYDELAADGSGGER